MDNIDIRSVIVEFFSVLELSSVENAKQYSDIQRTVQDSHAPPSQRNLLNLSSSPLFESIADESFIGKRERHQAERKQS